MTPSSLAAASLALWSTAVSATSLVAVARTLCRARIETPTATRPRCLVVRPCAGDEPSLLRALLSSSHLAEDREFKLIFAVARDDDPALPIAREACGALRERGFDATVRVTNARGANQKSSQLAEALSSDASHELAVVIDSDVDCEGLRLDALAAPFSDERVAAVWAPAVERAGVTMADRASEAVLAGSLHAFPVLSTIDGDGLVGKVVALRASSLAAVGGFTALERHLGEDMELARRFRALGMRCVALPITVTSLASARSWDVVIDRYARWITVIRAQRPSLLASYPALFFATWPIALSSAAVVAASTSSGAGALAATAACAAIASRLAVSLAARRAARHGLWSAPFDAVLADAVLAMAFARSLRTRTVTWRGRALRVDEGGVLTEA